MSDFASVSPEGFGLGWMPHLEDPARAAWASEGRPPRFESTVFAADDRPLPEAFTLASLVLWWYDQGPVGTCYGNAGTSAIQLANSAAVAAGEPFEEAQLSRAFVCYETVRRDNGGRPGDSTRGGTITNTMRALDEAGACRERLFPYRPDGRWLNRRPSDEAYAEAKSSQLTGVMGLRFQDAESRKRAIFNGNPPVRGIWWPFGWDRGQIDRYGRTNGLGGGKFGHALTDIGWVDKGVWDDHLWWHVLNSHGAIYPLPSPEMRAKVRGYASAREDRCYAFWVRDDLDLAVAGKGWAELIAPAGVAGFAVREVPIGWDRAGGG